MSFIAVSQKRSCIGQAKKTRLVVQALGLKGPGSRRVHKDNNCIRGMINTVQHLVTYEFVNAAEPKAVNAKAKTAVKKPTEKKDAASKK